MVRRLHCALRMTEAELKKRTKAFALAVIRFSKALPTDTVTTVITRQMVRSGTSVGANYRSACRGKSDPDFVAKLAIAEEEGDETQFWLEVLVEAGIVKPEAIATLWDEADQLVRILVASIKTVRSRIANNR